MPFFKSHQYKTHADLKELTPEEIVRLEPSLVKSSIENNTGGQTLTDNQIRALRTLLSIKRVEKDEQIPINRKISGRERVIQDFLANIGTGSVKNMGKYEKEVNDLIVTTHNQLGEERVIDKELDNRLKRLGNLPEKKYSDEENLHRRMANLKRGGKTKKRRKTHKKRNARHRKRSTKK